MEKKTFDSDELTKGGPYSHVVEAGGLLFVSGMIPVDASRGISVKDDIRAAARICLENVEKALRAAGSDRERIVKVTVFLRDMADFQAFNEVYRTYFPERPPARSCVAVRELPGNFPLEIEAVAIR